MNRSRLVWTVIKLLIFIVTRKNSASEIGIETRETISHVIKYNVEKYFSPLTVRMLVYNSEKLEFAWDLVRNYVVLIGDEKPVSKSVEPRSLSTEKVGFEPLFRYTVLTWVLDVGKVPVLLDQIKGSMNRRYDRLILIGTEDLISKIMVQDCVKEFKDKLAISIDSNNMWVDPLIYDNGKMRIVKSVGEFPVRHSMGGMLKGRHFKVAINEFKPLVYKIGSDSKGGTIVSGAGIRLIQSGAQSFNYTFETLYNPIWWGGISENGTWIGVLGYVHHKEIGCDIIPLAGHQITWSYAFDFTSMCGTVDKIFFTGQPRAIIEWYAFVLPFSWQVWLWTIVTFAFLTIVLFFVMYFVHNRKLKGIVWGTAFFMPFAIVMEQGLTDIPKGARYIAIVWLLGTVILGTGYKSTLRTNLMMPIPEVAPATWEQLNERQEYEILVYKATEMDVIGDSLPKTVAARMRVEMDMDKFFKYAYTTHRVAALSWNPMITSEILTRIPGNSFIYSQDNFNRLPLATYFQKHSIFVDSYMPVTAALFESGIFWKWGIDENEKFKKIGFENIENNETTALMFKELRKLQASEFDFESKPLTLWNFRMMFVILLIGCLVATAIFLVEYLPTRATTLNKNKRPIMNMNGENEEIEEAGHTKHEEKSEVAENESGKD